MPWRSKVKAMDQLVVCDPKKMFSFPARFERANCWSRDVSES